MHVECTASGDFAIIVSNEESNLVKNCMNEALNALQGDEFAIRVGTPRLRARELLELLLEERRLRTGPALFEEGAARQS